MCSPEYFPVIITTGYRSPRNPKRKPHSKCDRKEELAIKEGLSKVYNTYSYIKLRLLNLSLITKKGHHASNQVNMILFRVYRNRTLIKKDSDAHDMIYHIYGWKTLC